MGLNEVPRRRLYGCRVCIPKLRATAGASVRVRVRVRVMARVRVLGSGYWGQGSMVRVVWSG